MAATVAATRRSVMLHCKALVDLRAVDPPPIEKSRQLAAECPRTARGAVTQLTSAYTLVAQASTQNSCFSVELKH